MSIRGEPRSLEIRRYAVDRNPLGLQLGAQLIQRKLQRVYDRFFDCQTNRDVRIRQL